MWRRSWPSLGRYGIAHMIDGAVRTRLADFLPSALQQPGDALSDGERLPRALIELGPTFIKLGQVLSTRIDLVGPDVAADLRELQTNVTGRPRRGRPRDDRGRPGPAGGGGVRGVRLPRRSRPRPSPRRTSRAARRDRGRRQGPARRHPRWWPRTSTSSTRSRPWSRSTTRRSRSTGRAASSSSCAGPSRPELDL